MEAALGIACKFPFAPDEIIKVGVNKNSCGLLEAVLRIGNEKGQRAPSCKWPSKVEDFGHGMITDAQGRAMPVDAEWVAAALVAAGCNPWKLTDTFPREVDQAIDLGMTGLVETMFCVEGAWHPDRALLETMGGHMRQLGRLASKPHKAGVLDVLTRGGISHWQVDDKMIGDLGDVHVDCLAVLVDNGLDLGSPGVKSKLERAWLERVKSKWLEPDTCTRMQQIAFGKASADMDSSAMAIAQALAVDWGSSANGSSARAYDFMTNTGAAALCGKGRVARGQMAGQWSVLAAGVMSRIRQARLSSWITADSASGCLGWSSRLMVQSRVSGKGWERDLLDASDPTIKGCLREAVGFEWNKGISINGILALGLWGQEDNKEIDYDMRAADFAALVGIDDINQWSKDNAGHAAAFTCSIIKPNTVTVARSMLSTWSRALHRFPGMIEGVDEQARVDLLHSLTCMFNLASSWSADRDGHMVLQKLAGQMFEGLEESDLGHLQTDPGPRREAALVLAMTLTLLSNQTSTQRVNTIKHVRDMLAQPEDQGGATAREKDILASWAKANGPDGIMRVQADALLMDISTARAQPGSGRKAPRF